MSTGRSLLSLVVAENFIYAIGGQCEQTTLATVERYNIKTNVWAAVRSMAFPRAAAAATILNNNIYVIGGSTQCNSCETATVERLNFQTERWTTVRTSQTKEKKWRKLKYFLCSVRSRLMSCQRLFVCGHFQKQFDRGWWVWREQSRDRLRWNLQRRRKQVESAAPDGKSKLSRHSIGNRIRN